MRKTSYKQRYEVFKEWKAEGIIEGMPGSIISKVEREFFEKDKLIRRWEEEAKNFSDIGENEERDLALDEAFEIQCELVESLNLKKFAS